MACRPHLERCWNVANWALGKKWHFNRNSNIFILENVFENVVWKMVAILSRSQCVIPMIILLRPSDAYMRQQTIPSLVQIMACRLFGDKPLSEPMIVYCQMESNGNISMTFYLKFKCFHSRKCIGSCRLQKWRLSCLGLNVLNCAQPIPSIILRVYTFFVKCLAFNLFVISIADSDTYILLSNMFIMGWYEKPF